MSGGPLNEGTLLLLLVLPKQLQSDLWMRNVLRAWNETILLFFQYRATTLPAFKYYVTCAYLIFFCIFIVQILVLPKYVRLVFHSWFTGTMHVSIFKTFAMACSYLIIHYTMNLSSPKGTTVTFNIFQDECLGNILRSGFSHSIYDPPHMLRWTLPGE